MKKFFAMAILGLLLAGCGDSGNSGDDHSGDGSHETVTDTTAGADTHSDGDGTSDVDAPGTDENGDESGDESAQNSSDDGSPAGADMRTGGAAAAVPGNNFNMVWQDEPEAELYDIIFFDDNGSGMMRSVQDGDPTIHTETKFSYSFDENFLTIARTQARSRDLSADAGEWGGWAVFRALPMIFEITGGTPSSLKAKEKGTGRAITFKRTDRSTPWN